MEPSPEARSTLEAAAHSIALLQDGEAASHSHALTDPGGPTDLTEVEEERNCSGPGRGGAVRDALLRVLLRMVELQCAHITKPKHRKDAKNYRQNRYNISALQPPPLLSSAVAAARGQVLAKTTQPLPPPCACTGAVLIYISSLCWRAKLSTVHRDGHTTGW